MTRWQELPGSIREGLRPEPAEALELAGCNDLPALIEAAAAIRDEGHGSLVSYSPKVFIPLTRLCRDVCRYCTFARTPDRQGHDYLREEEILAIARAGVEAGCHEALFTLGDKPELRYRSAREELRELGQLSTISYLREMARTVLERTGLLPHINAGVMSRDEMLALRWVSVSQGLMLESASSRLCEKGGPHFGSPDKQPTVRLSTIAAAGSARIPFTSGILIGIGETRRERIESLLALRALHASDGHLQEVIIQNFRRKPGTPMQDAPEPSLADLLWTIAVARIVLGPEMNIQVPPNLSPGPLKRVVEAGINDWGGISPVTPDHVNPEAAWPHLERLNEATEAAGKRLVARLPLYPAYVQNLQYWVDPSLHRRILQRTDATGHARTDGWHPGNSEAPVPELSIGGGPPRIASGMTRLLDRAISGRRLEEQEIARLFSARGSDFERVCHAADELRRAVVGDTVTYVVNRNINYTNICYFGCRFCAFSKGRVSENLRERGYVMSLAEIGRRVQEARDRGATEICLQGGIHPDYTGETYLEITRAVRRADPAIHIHGFSPLEISHGAETLGLSLGAYLGELKRAGLGSLPGTAAEILDDEIRALICPDKIDTARWLKVMRRAHDVGLYSTATIMFGHVDTPVHWARHLLRVRDLQAETGGFTEFVPLPYVHMQAPMSRKGLARPGPTLRETILMHAVARLTLHPELVNIQASWVKLGPRVLRMTLAAGVNDLGGTLMEESISRAAGAAHGQEMPPERMEALILECGRTPAQRTTLYQLVVREQAEAVSTAC